MKVAFCSSEVVPFAKTGGLADVSATLPVDLHNLGVDVRIFMPKYSCVDTQRASTKLYGIIPVYFIENDKFFSREGLYGTSRGDYPDNLERFSFFSGEILKLIKEIDFKPDVIHCNDWQTALIPVYLHTLYHDEEFYKNIVTVLTVHNLAYQGSFPPEGASKLGLPDWASEQNLLSHRGSLNFLKAGLLCSRVISTVSKSYAQEIQTARFGCGLHQILKARARYIFGIINGIDYISWSPEHDKFIWENYSCSDLQGKVINKKKLQELKGLKVDAQIPLLGIIARLTRQKGLDLLIKTIKRILNLGYQIIILGTGEARYHTLLEEVSRRYRDRVSVNLEFSPDLAHKIYAGVDIFLMPSRYEPCGLGQLISFKYGTIPLAYKTGGLADTVIDYSRNHQAGNGFVFARYSARDFFLAMKRCLLVYRTKDKWEQLVKRVMRLNFSWEESAKKYLQLYESIAKQ